MKSKLIIFCACLCCLPIFTFAQSNNPFAAAIAVNDGVITRYELDQRILLLQAFGSSGDLKELATTQLIDDRLKIQAARSLNITVSPEELETGMADFAARGELTTEQLISYIGQRGIARQTFRDFVQTGYLWRGFVRAKFGAKASIRESEIEAAINLSAASKQESILFSEIILPNQERGDDRTRELAQSLSESIKSEAAFSAAARRYSRSPSAGRGGKLDWVSTGTLPAQITGQILALSPGEVTGPIVLGGATGIFQLRGVRTDEQTGETEVSASYLSVPVPTQPGKGDTPRSAALKLLGDVDNCADLKAQSERFGDNSFTEYNLLTAEIPTATALELAKLDANEAAITPQSDGRLHILMLCNRSKELAEGSRETIANALFQQRMGSFGDGYLQDLKGDANIVRY